MPYNISQLDKIIWTIFGVLKRSDVRSKEWDRQTDSVKMQFANAQMYAEAIDRFFLFDVHIAPELKHEAVKDGTQFAAQFFTKRCHDKGFVCPRLAVLDTKKSRAQGGVNGGLANLHVHGGALVPEGENDDWLRMRLREVFGFTPNHIGNRHQIRIYPPDTKRHSTFQERKGKGVSGRTNYMLSHAGTTFNDLRLNEDGKRKRRAPLDKARVNKKSKGLARGIPTNFCSAIMLWDNQSKIAAKAAFDDWIRHYDEAEAEAKSRKLEAA